MAQHLQRDPTDPAMPVAAPPQASAFADYRPFRGQKVAPWKQVLDEAASVPGAAGHAGHSAMGATTAEPKEVMPASNVTDNRKGPTLVEPKPPSETATPRATITATGVVQSIDQANGKVKLTHDPITVLGWPKMTMFFRLKDAALAEQVKEGDAVQFDLEKSPSGYVISGLKKVMPEHDMLEMNKRDER